MKNLYFLFIYSLLLLLFSNCNNSKPRYYKLAGSAWNTSYHITYKGTSNLIPLIEDQIALVNNTLSPFTPSSQISRINRNECDSAGPELREVFALAQEVNRLSGGIFDPSVAPLINLWGFGYASGTHAPSQEQIDSALQAVGIADCHFSADSLRIIKKSPHTEFNFSAIAKGYGVDLIARALRNAGVEDYMVEVGGEIAMSGLSPRSTPWRIQIDAPSFSSVPTHNSYAFVELTDCALATSGNYRNFHQHADSIVGHTISPISGLPVISSTLSATVIAPTCALADALATSVMAMPASQASSMIESVPDAAALIVVLQADTLASIKVNWPE